jgi:methyl halide transferase
MELDARYWQNRYLEGNTPWDIGGISPAILDYLEALPPGPLRILIPGAGKAHEAKWLLGHGFTDVWVCDWAEAAILAFRDIAPEFPERQLLCRDFFTLEGPFDLILEQTFVSALPPERWPDWAACCARLLRPGGRVAGLLFATPFENPGPPFGAHREGYQKVMAPWLDVSRMDISLRSIPPRLGNELFFEARRSET